MHLHSIQIGKAQRRGGPEKTSFAEKQWESGIVKKTIDHPASLSKTGIVGDEQADLRVHGGPDKAICVYSIDHFAFWKTELDLELSPGGFGENFSVKGITEDEICIGDAYGSGEVRLQVTQPRQPCWKLARRWGVQTMPALVQKTGRTGWYLRVLAAGDISAPTDLALIERPHSELTITRANHVMYQDRKNEDAAAALADIAPLSEAWRETLTKRLG